MILCAAKNIDKIAFELTESIEMAHYIPELYSVAPRMTWICVDGILWWGVCCLWRQGLLDSWRGWLRHINGRSCLVPRLGEKNNIMCCCWRTTPVLLESQFWPTLKGSPIWRDFNSTITYLKGLQWKIHSWILLKGPLCVFVHFK